MSLPAASSALKVPGKLCAQLNGDTFDFATAFPHGGTALGLKRAVRLRRREFRGSVTAEEFGGPRVAVRYLGEEWELALELRGHDTDAIQLVFPGTVTDTQGGPGIVYPDGTGEAWRNDDAVPLLFSPDDTDRHKAVLFTSAVPLLAEEQERRHGKGPEDEAVWQVAFLALRTGATAGAGVQVRYLGDLSL